MDFCKSNCLYILNGRTSVDKNVGKATCKSVSTVDYFLTSPNLFELIDHFQVHDFCQIISDVHCLVSLHLSLDLQNVKLNPQINNDQPRLWDSSKIGDFKSNINLEEIKCLNETILHCMSKKYVSQEDVDDIANNLSSCIISSAEKSFCKMNKNIKNFEEIQKWC